MASTKSELGAALGVSFQQVQKYERGTTRVSSSSLVVISKLVGVAPAELLGGLDAPDVASPERDLTRQFLATPCGLEIAKAVLALPLWQAALVAQVAGGLARASDPAGVPERAAA